MLSLSEDQVRHLAGIDEVIAAIRSAFTRDYSATLRMPVRTTLELAGGAVLLLMPCYDSALGVAGVKTVTVSPGNGVQATYDLFAPESGTIVARMAANYLTDIRTAATSAVATDLLARPVVETLGIFGCGRQAIAHLSVLPKVRQFQRFLVCGSEPGRAESFCARLRHDLGINATAADADTCASASDVICTCTSSPTPVFDGRRLRPGTHLNLVGAFQPETREVDDETVKRARIVVDTYDGALAEAGDLLLPLKNGIIGRDRIVADLHQLASGKTPGRFGGEDVTVFKSVGCALEDLVTARLVYEKAVAGI
jgi:ornithine cyclodeaminase/alanine dehydrogenase-like protein (mu-crystallin family)